MDPARPGGAASVRRLEAFSVHEKLRVSMLALFFVGALAGEVAEAQTGVYQQTLPVSVAEAKAAVQKLSMTFKGRLPTLEGFVQTGDQPIERYEKGYYEC